MLKAILTTETGEILETKDLIAVVSFSPVVLLDGGVYLFWTLKSPTEAIYRQVRYYRFLDTPVEEEQFTGVFPGYLPFLP